MKIYAIILFIFLLNVSLGVVQSEPLFNALSSPDTPIYLGDNGNTTSGGALNGSAPNLPTDS